MVKVVGYRLTKGTRLSEKLYTRTANIFFKAKKEEINPEAIEVMKLNIKKIYTLLKNYENKNLIEYQKFEKLLLEKKELEQNINQEIVSSIPGSEELSKLFSKTDIDNVNYITEFAARIIAIIKYPELIKDLQSIFNKDK